MIKIFDNQFEIEINVVYVHKYFINYKINENEYNSKIIAFS